MAVGATVAVVSRWGKPRGRVVMRGAACNAAGDCRMHIYMQQDFLAAMTILGVADSWEWPLGVVLWELKEKRGEGMAVAPAPNPKPIPR